MTLKTLKDIDWIKDERDKGIWVSSEEIKKEAIKWVKQIKKDGNSWDLQMFLTFFNITEEDLK